MSKCASLDPFGWRIDAWWTDESAIQPYGPRTNRRRRSRLLRGSQIESRESIDDGRQSGEGARPAFELEASWQMTTRFNSFHFFPRLFRQLLAPYLPPSPP
jgi:hypothetical protein